MLNPLVRLAIAVTVLVPACTSAGALQTNVRPPRAEPSNTPPPANPTITPSPAEPIDLSSLTGRITFSAGAQGAVDVYVVNLDGTGLRRLTSTPGDQFDPAWSPDGRLIAYRSEPHDDPELWVMRADGSNQHRLTPDGGFPDWSRDGSMIAYAPGGGPSGRSWIATMPAAGSEPHRISHTDWGEYPSLSPDGRRVAFNSNVSGEARMAIVDVAGSNLVDLSAAGEGGQVAWSPDGGAILFASHRDHADAFRDIYTMRPDGSGVRRLSNVGAEMPAWSPDGRYVVFTAPGGLGVMRANGSGLTMLPIEGVVNASFPNWR